MLSMESSQLECPDLLKSRVFKVSQGQCLRILFVCVLTFHPDAPTAASPPPRRTQETVFPNRKRASSFLRSTRCILKVLGEVPEWSIMRSLS